MATTGEEASAFLQRRSAGLFRAPSSLLTAWNAPISNKGSSVRNLTLLSAAAATSSGSSSTAAFRFLLGSSVSRSYRIVLNSVSEVATNTTSSPNSARADAGGTDFKRTTVGRFPSVAEVAWSTRDHKS